MKTVEFKTTDGRTRYYLAREDGLPVDSVMKYLKFRDAAGYARDCRDKEAKKAKDKAIQGCGYGI